MVPAGNWTAFSTDWMEAWALGIYFTVGNPMIQQVGMLIARGALFSVILIFFVLPLLFTSCDAIVQRSSYKIGFYQGQDDSGRDGSKPDGSQPLPTRV